MILITGASLADARKAGMEELEALANDLLPASSPHHEARKQEFMAAVEDDDDKRINTMLAEALERYLGSANLLEGLGAFCQRMDLPSNVIEMGEAGALEWIAAHSAEIAKKLDKEAQDATK